MTLKERTAQCACGQAKITLKGEPIRVISCHCNYCQRRTGSVFQVSAWFADEQVVNIRGQTKVFSESARSKGVKFHFCGVCGTTLFWTFSHVSGYHSVAVGCFNDPNFPAPSYEMHLAKKHHWMNPIMGIEHFPNWPPKEYLE